MDQDERPAASTVVWFGTDMAAEGAEAEASRRRFVKTGWFRPAHFRRTQRFTHASTAETCMPLTSDAQARMDTRMLLRCP